MVLIILVMPQQRADGQWFVKTHWPHNQYKKNI